MTSPATSPAELHALLAARGETVAAAESLTAGLWCATYADVPGVSATLRGGVVVYATDLKATLAGVPADVLAAHGPVAAETAAALAAGVRERLSATYGVGLTGVAGPDPQDGHPAGAVFVAAAGPSGVQVRPLTLAGDRAAIRKQAVSEAFNLLAALVRGHS